MPGITGLGHVGLFCEDLDKMRDFYSRFMGLTITDEDFKWGIVFLSADPKSEHHELALGRAREGVGPTKNVQQLSFIVEDMASLRDYYHRIKQEGLRIDRTVTHGISCSIYFWDPEDNRIELYYKTGYEVRQPLGEEIDLDNPAAEVLPCSKALETTLGTPVGATK